jgi:hypothetical protein
MLSLHHAHILRGYQQSPEPGTTSTLTTAITGDGAAGAAAPHEVPDPPADHTEVVSIPLTANGPAQIVVPVDLPLLSQPHAHRVSAYSRSSNPWFGYPAVRLSPSASARPHLSHLLPLYPRNRKRDLVKTLLFLFMLRLQSIRDKVERRLGLHHLGAVPWSRHLEGMRARTPHEGLRMQDAARSKMDGGRVVWGGWRRKGEWVWMIIGLVLFRGGWTRLWSALAMPLGWAGTEGLRAVLGLA